MSGPDLAQSWVKRDPTWAVQNLGPGGHSSHQCPSSLEGIHGIRMTLCQGNLLLSPKGI